MRYEYRISKYDPKCRDEFGSYTQIEWTHFAQVGTTVGAEKLTMREYRRVETAYLQTISEMLVEAGISRLVVARLRWVRKRPEAVENVRVGRTIDRRTALVLCRLALRDLVDAAFNCPRQMYLHFGFDFYVYLGLSKPTPAALSAAHQRGIYVEQMASPYRKKKRKSAQ